MTTQHGSSLPIDIKELRDQPGHQKVIDQVVDTPAGFSAVLVGFPQGSPIDLDLRLESVHEGVLMTGTASGEVEGQCGRCLDEIRYPLTVDVMQLFSYPERAVGGEEEDERLISEDSTIDLEPVLRDLMVSALPFQPVCREDCPGLCAQCGKRLEEDPDHQHEQLDPRWAALQDLKDKLD